jgi:hypothetical protein
MLTASGVGQIDLVGPFPEWPNGLPRTLVTYMRRSRSSAAPFRLREGWNRRVLTLDREMQAFAVQHGARYVSPVDILCNEAGCLTRLRDDATSLVAWDQSHLTDAGSAFFVSQFNN